MVCSFYFIFDDLIYAIRFFWRSRRLSTLLCASFSSFYIMVYVCLCVFCVFLNCLLCVYCVCILCLFVLSFFCVCVYVYDVL